MAYGWGLRGPLTSWSFWVGGSVPPGRWAFTPLGAIPAKPRQSGGGPCPSAAPWVQPCLSTALRAPAVSCAYAQSDLAPLRLVAGTDLSLCSDCTLPPPWVENKREGPHRELPRHARTEGASHTTRSGGAAGKQNRGATTSDPTPSGEGPPAAEEHKTTRRQKRNTKERRTFHGEPVCGP